MKSPATKRLDSTPILFEDSRLKGAYTVMEVATLAASCRGRGNPTRIENAVQLLSAVEAVATLTKEQKLRQRVSLGRESRGQNPTTNEIDSTLKVMAGAEDEIATIERILKASERDKATGKIKRTSLAFEAYQEAGIGKTPEHAARLFTDWQIANWESMEKYYHEAGETPPTLDEFKALTASGARDKLIHDDETAHAIAYGFFNWLKLRPKEERPEVLRVAKGDQKGKIVSPKNRGADRTGDGRYSKKKSGQ